MDSESHRLLPPGAFQDAAFPLETNEMLNIQVYVNRGMRLPITLTDYQKEFTLGMPEVEKFQENIAGIVCVYRNIYDHTTTFRSLTLPGIVGLASSVYHYSDEAPVHYDFFDKEITRLAGLEDSDLYREREPFDKHLQTQVTRTTNMQRNAEQILARLRGFSKDTSSDLIDLEHQDKKLDTKLFCYQEKILILEEKFKQLQSEVDARRKSVKDLVLAFIRLTGRANKIIKDLANTNDELEAYLRMKLKGKLMADDLKQISQLAKSVTNSVESMIGAFQSMTDDLKFIQEMTDKNIRKAQACFAATRIDHVKDRWVALSKKADRYRMHAFVSPNAFIETDVDLGDAS